MDESSVQTTAWYRALTLTERVASLRATGGSAPRAPVDADRADRRLARWRAEPPFASGADFARRLSMDDIGEEEMRTLLGEPITAVRDRCPAPPTWLEEIERAYARPPSAVGVLPPPSIVSTEDGFLALVAPLIALGRDRLRDGVSDLVGAGTELPFDPDTVVDLLIAGLPGRLLPPVSRTLVLELQVARLQELLPGETPEQRFGAFIDRLTRRDTALAILAEYPVLARQLTMAIDQWVAFSLEFLRHLCADWQVLQTAFGRRGELGPLVEVESDAGDQHRDGRSVLIARFESGVKVVYKPRSLAIDVHVQALLTWLNERGDHPPFRTLTILDRPDYGWVEFVAAEGCATVAEVRRFYERQGGYLALLYALEATDLHLANLIAAGEHPVLLDLEALFHPRPDEARDDPAERALDQSVLRVGLLPQRRWATADSVGIDLSGLGGAAGQLTPFAVPLWERTGTDEMHATRQRVALPDHTNRPTVGGVAVGALDHAEAITTGFARLYRLLVAHRDALLADDGPLARFADVQVRFIPRPTQTYAALLRESCHPDVLRDALDRDRLFDRLWSGVAQLPELARLIPAERADLLRGDVPLFTTRPDSRHLWTSRAERLPDYFPESALTLVRRRLRRLGDDDLTHQLWLIRASLATLATGPVSDRQATPRPNRSPVAVDRVALLAAAGAVGARLEELAQRAEDGAGWIGLTLQDDRHWSLAPLGLDLYDGVPGVALFLGYLGAITGERRWTALAHAAMRTLRRRIERERPALTSVGGFAGWGGVIYALTHLGVLWADPALLAEAEALVELLPPLIAADDELDVIAGAAGGIGGLLGLYRVAPSRRTLAAAIACGDRLIARAQTMEQGIAWAPKRGGSPPLTGFAHGAAGIAWALLELSGSTAEARFRTAALAALAYERSLFSPEAGNWPDLRPGAATEPIFQTVWCHGAVGIGLARLRTLPHLDDAATRAEIRAALRTTVGHGFGGNHSLCHGALGNLEFLLQASQAVAAPRWQAQLSRGAATILDQGRRDGWRCGNPLEVESPGLMTGLAGIGYGMLRLAEPRRVPSVLVLQPPPLGGVSPEPLAEAALVEAA